MEAGHTPSCGICGANHSPMQCNVIGVVSHIPDKSIPSKARLTLPDDLEIKKLSDDTHTITALFSIEKGTQFGPLQARKICTLLPTIYFPLKVFCSSDEEFQEYFLDTSDENECSWMMFIAPASDFQEQNLICYQDAEDLYYVAIRDILEGEHLKVWYSPHYATKMQKELLTPISNEPIDYPECNSAALEKNKNVLLRDTWCCKYCGKVENKVSEFAKHLLRHYRILSGRYCHMCNISFLKKQGYQKHLKIVHEEDIPPEILFSPEPTQTETNLIQQDATSFTEISSDVYVGGPFLNEVIVESLDISTLDLSQSLNNSFDLATIENRGILFEGENIALNMESILGEDHFNFELKENESEQFVCDICLRTFKKLKFLIFHMDSHTGKHTCQICWKIFARKENLSHHPCKSYYKLKCRLCDKLFVQQKYLNYHMKTVHEASFSCKTCKKHFSSKLNLRSHTCLTPAKKQVFTCDICNKKFNTKKYHSIHVKRHQLPKEIYPCLSCNMTLSSRKSYEAHVKLHEGHSYQCDECQKVFTRSDTLSHHKKTVHSDNKETCETCGKELKSKKLLNAHMLTHQEVNPHKCPHCPNTYRQNKNLLRHIKLNHTSDNTKKVFSEMEKPFSCPKCDKKVKTTHSLNRHLKSFHPEYRTSQEEVGRNRRKSEVPITLEKVEEQAVFDLKQTIDNMDFNTDDINPINTEINIEIDKFLNNPEIFASDSRDKLLESLIDSVEVVVDNETDLRENDVFLSMPMLDIDQDSSIS